MIKAMVKMPERSGTGPDMNREQVAEMLGYTGTQYVWKLTNLPEGHPKRLPAFVLGPEGWTEKKQTSKKQRGLYFYRADVEDYLARNPELSEEEIKETLSSSVAIPQDLYTEIVKLGTPEMETKGYVTRTRILDTLLLEGHKNHAALYKMIQRVAVERGWPIAKPQGKLTQRSRPHKKK